VLGSKQLQMSTEQRVDTYTVVHGKWCALSACENHAVLACCEPSTVHIAIMACCDSLNSLLRSSSADVTE
jgi:hypothetical protein